MKLMMAVSSKQIGNLTVNLTVIILFLAIFYCFEFIRS